MNRKFVTKRDIRKRRHARVRAVVQGTVTRPRLSVFRSNRFISAQLIDDTNGRTLAAAHGREFSGKQATQAAMVGSAIAKAAKVKGIARAVFDRSGYRYAGHIKSLADAARAGGLSF